MAAAPLGRGSVSGFITLAEQLLKLFEGGVEALRVVEDALKGKDVKATIKAAAAQIRTVARPMSLNAYKDDIAQGLVERTVLQALG